MNRRSQARSLRAAENELPRPFEIRDQAVWNPIVKSRALSLFLDFDGTLVEIGPSPEQVVLTEPSKQYLRELLALPRCAVGIASGRPIAELKQLINLDGLYYIGCHGLEWVAPDGTRSTSWPGDELLDALRSLHEEMREIVAAFDGVLLENKETALALHYRQAAEATALAARKEFVRAVHWYQQQGANLELLAGKAVIEAKPAGRTKGDAIAQILSRYAPDSFPIYIGDDITDEAAFHAVVDAGLAILVSAVPRPTAASFFLKGPKDVLAFIRSLIHLRTGS